MLNPGVLDGGDLIDTETNQSLDREKLVRNANRFAGLVQILAEVERGTITLSLTEYRGLPATFLEARQIFRALWVEHQKPK